MRLVNIFGFSFAFIHYTDPTEAKKVHDSMQDYMYEGRSLVIMYGKKATEGDDLKRKAGAQAKGAYRYLSVQRTSLDQQLLMPDFWLYFTILKSIQCISLLVPHIYAFHFLIHISLQIHNLFNNSSAWRCKFIYRLRCFQIAAPRP